MIEFIKGELAALEADKAVVEVGGVGIWCLYVGTGPGECFPSPVIP